MIRDRILVTGATGFVGRGLVAELAASAYPLTLALRQAASAAERDAGKGSDECRRVAVGEIGPDTDWRVSLAGVSTVVHLAGHVHIAPERAVEETALFDAVNHRGTVRLYEAAAEAGLDLFVFLSTINVLGTATPPGRPFTDASSPDPTTPYATSKHLAEAALTRRAAAGGPRLVILRPPLVAGPGVKGNLARLLRLADRPFPLPLGRLTNRRTLLSRDNLVAAIRRVVEHGAGAPAGTWILGDREPVSTSDIVAALRAGLGRPPRLLPAPVRLLRPALAAAGWRGLDQRLFGDLELDSSGFRRAFAWDDVVDTLATLRATAAYS